MTASELYGDLPDLSVSFYATTHGRVPFGGRLSVRSLFDAFVERKADLEEREAFREEMIAAVVVQTGIEEQAIRCFLGDQFVSGEVDYHKIPSVLANMLGLRAGEELMFFLCLDFNRFVQIYGDWTPVHLDQLYRTRYGGLSLADMVFVYNGLLGHHEAVPVREFPHWRN